MQNSPYAAPETRVRSDPIANGKPTVRQSPNPGMWALAIALLVFGIIGWLAGGKYTVEGWVVALNMFARWIGVTQQLPMPRGWWLVGAVALAGVVYSRVETQALHKRAQRLPSFWVGWALIVLTDVGSTLLGVLNPAPNAAPILLQLAQIIPLAILWSLLLTFIPEWLIISAWTMLRR